MMKIFKIVLLVLLIISVSTKVTFAKSNTLTQKQLKRYKPLKVNEGKALKSLKTAKLSDVHLAKPVKYFDIKRYDSYNKYEGGCSFDMAAYKKLSDREKKKIRSARRIKPHKTFWKIYTPDIVEAGYYNLHYLDSDLGVHTIASRKKLLDFLGTIDTSTELSMVLFNMVRGKIRYKKVGNLYIIRGHDVSYTDCDGCGEPACTLFVRHMIIDSRGNVLIDKTVSEKDFKSEKACSKL